MDLSWSSPHISLIPTYGRIHLGHIATPLEIVYNKPQPSILPHLQDRNTWKIIILFLQEVKWDIIYRYAQLKNPR